jgi:hypothetical protein
MKTSSKLICVIAVLLLLQISAANAQERTPRLEMKVAPTDLYVPQPCPTTSEVTLKFRNNGLVDPITVVWSSTFLAHPLECVGDYTEKSGTVGPIPPQGVMEELITLSFIGDCEGTTMIKFSGFIQGDITDTHSDTLTVYCNEARVPSLTNWGMLALLVLLVLSAVFVIRQRRRGVLSA